MRKRIRELLDGRSSTAARVIDGFIVVLILLSCTSVILETLPKLSAEARPWLRRFEIFSVAIFSVEYILRVSSAEKPLRKACEPMVIIDLLAILPFYVGLFAIDAIDLRFLRLLRSLRILRVLKMHRYSTALAMLVAVINETKHQLISFLFVALLCLVLMGSGLYNIEPQTFESIPHAIWWSVVTLTTVGYGDVVPETGFGQMLAGSLMLLGVGIVAIPTGIISSAMVRHYDKLRGRACGACELASHDRDAQFCNRCGEELGNEVEDPREQPQTPP